MAGTALSVRPEMGIHVFGVVRMSAIVLGAILAALGGLNSLVGFDAPDATLQTLPGYDLIAANPGAAVGIGLVLVAGALILPSGPGTPKGWS